MGKILHLSFCGSQTNAITINIVSIFVFAFVFAFVFVFGLMKCFKDHLIVDPVARFDNFGTHLSFSLFLILF